MITCTMLAALGHHEELRAHLGRRAQRRAHRATSCVEVLMQVAVYAGVPTAVSALRAAADVLLTDD